MITHFKHYKLTTVICQQQPGIIEKVFWTVLKWDSPTSQVSFPVPHHSVWKGMINKPLNTKKTFYYPDVIHKSWNNEWKVCNSYCCLSTSPKWTACRQYGKYKVETDKPVLDTWCWWRLVFSTTLRHDGHAIVLCTERLWSSNSVLEIFSPHSGHGSVACTSATCRSTSDFISCRGQWGHGTVVCCSVTWRSRSLLAIGSLQCEHRVMFRTQCTSCTVKFAAAMSFLLQAQQ